MSIAYAPPPGAAAAPLTHTPIHLDPAVKKLDEQFKQQIKGLAQRDRMTPVEETQQAVQRNDSSRVQRRSLADLVEQEEDGGFEESPPTRPTVESQPQRSFARGGSLADLARAQVQEKYGSGTAFKAIERKAAAGGARNPAAVAAAAGIKAHGKASMERVAQAGKRRAASENVDESHSEVNRLKGLIKMVNRPARY